MSNSPRILVLGDAMADIYIHGTSTRLSPEAPIPVVSVTDTLEFPGGAANVAANIRSLGGECQLLCGTSQGDAIPRKYRLLSCAHNVARWDMDDQVNPLNITAIDEVVYLFKPDSIIISDYGKGSINLDVIRVIAEKKLPTYIDTKQDPWSFIKEVDSPYRITFFPNEVEYHQHETAYNRLPRVVLKRAAQGMEFREFGKVRESVPAYARKVVSVCGAGDTVIAAYTFVSSFDGCGEIHISPLKFAAWAAGVVVEKSYTATATLEEVCSDFKWRQVG